jgi:hypothetical protein
MPLQNMKAIQTVTVGAGGAASIDFTNIPQTYTDLHLLVSLREESSTSAVAFIKFNNATANRSERYIQGNGSSATSGTTSVLQFIVCQPSDTASTFGNASIYIPNYTSSNFKSVSSDSVSENNATSAFSRLVAGLWADTSAINQITITTDTGDVAQYSTATLYGVTSAGYGAKATGGIISQDANYYYHTFVASGTFTPTSNITADYLVVAGGGGGASQHSGGGGGGGLRCTVGATGGGGSLESALSLTASTNYTVTVGAGGSGGSPGGSGSSGSNSVFSSITSTGGGGGGVYGDPNGVAGSSGGSGGGGGAAAAGSGGAGGAGTTNQGYAGGAGVAAVSGSYKGGGGGGAGAVGQTPTSGANTSAGNGGAGVTTSISGSSVGYAGGGGAGLNGGSGSAGTATDGGGAGTKNSGNGTAGTAYTGGGGGSAGSNANSGGAGGSGIVIVRYAK